MSKLQKEKIKRKDKVYKKIEGKTYVLDDKTDELYTLNETAGFVWEEISEEKSFDKLVDAVVDEFEVGRKKAKKDLEDLISYFKKRDLITVKDPIESKS